MILWYVVCKVCYTYIAGVILCMTNHSNNHRLRAVTLLSYHCYNSIIYTKQLLYIQISEVFSYLEAISKDVKAMKQHAQMKHYSTVTITREVLWPEVKLIMSSAEMVSQTSNFTKFAFVFYSGYDFIVTKKT